MRFALTYQLAASRVPNVEASLRMQRRWETEISVSWEPDLFFVKEGTIYPENVRLRVMIWFVMCLVLVCPVSCLK